MKPFSPAAVRAEALLLRALLVDNSRLIARSLRPVELPDTEPALVRAFWNALGWSPVFGNGLGPPERELARQQAERTLAEWRSWGQGFELTLDALPQHFRVLEPNTEGVGFSLTDEDGDSPDPPVLIVSADEGTVTSLFPSYLRPVGHTLLGFALRGWYQTSVQVRPEVGALDGVTTPFAYLAPSAVKLTEEVWSLPWRPFDTSPSPHFHHARFEALIDWLFMARSLEAIHIPKLPGRVWTPRASLDDVDEAFPGLRVLPGIESGWSYRVGPVEGVQVLLSADASGQVRLAANIRHAEQVTRILGEQGWLPAHEQP